MVLGVVLLLAVSAGLTVALRPGRLWPLITSAAVLGSGVMINGYALVDEVLAAAIVAGGLLSIAVRRIRPRPNPLIDPALTVFLLLLGYMAWEGLRSPLLVEDWRMSRWVVYYLIIAGIAWLNTRWRFAADGQRTALVITMTGFAYLIVYVAIGVAAERVYHVSRWALQSIMWAGSAYALFPLTLIVPATLIVIASHRGVIRWIAVASVLMAMVAAIYYDSRIAWLVIIVFLILSPTVLGLRRQVLVTAVALVVLGLLLSQHYKVDLRAHVQRLWESARAIYAPRPSDLDRSLHFTAAVQAVEGDVGLLIVGVGTYAHRDVLAPYLRNLYVEFLPGVAVSDAVRTTGFSGLLVDAGVTGVLLSVGVAAFAAREILLRSRRSPGVRPILLTSVPLLLLWMMVSDIRDNLLFYLAVMPSGLLAQLSQHRLEPSEAGPRIGREYVA